MIACTFRDSFTTTSTLSPYHGKRVCEMGTMFPPVDDTALQNNPDFANLYKKLTHVVLNPDGSTKNDPAAKEREAVRQVREKLGGIQRLR